MPTVLGGIIASEEDADALQVPKVGAGRTGRYVEAIGKAAKLITDRPVFAGVIGPFSLSGRLMDVSEALIYCYEEPDMVKKVLEKTTAFLTEYILAYKAVGANGVVIADPGGASLPGVPFGVLGYVRRIIKAVKDETSSSSITTAARAPCPASHQSCGWAPRLSLRKRRVHEGHLERVPEDVLVMGNVDPAAQFANGNPHPSGRIPCRSWRSVRPPNLSSPRARYFPRHPGKNIDAFFRAVDRFTTARLDATMRKPPLRKSEGRILMQA